MSDRFLRLRWTFMGLVLGMTGVAMFIGAQIGLEQSRDWPAWLTVPLGVVAGPAYIVADLMTLYAGIGHAMIVLPQSLVGGVLGGVLGWWLARSEERRARTAAESSRSGG